MWKLAPKHQPIQSELAAIKDRIAALDGDLVERDHQILGAELGTDDVAPVRLAHEGDKDAAAGISRDFRELTDRATAAHEKMVQHQKLVLALSSGALALSITFRGTLAPEGAQEITLLRNGWIGFTAAILAGLFVSYFEAFHLLGVRPNRVFALASALLPITASMCFLYATISFVLFALANA